jgi:NMD protein affecting ribosome stability and mRNA decay
MEKMTMINCGVTAFLFDKFVMRCFKQNNKPLQVKDLFSVHHKQYCSHCVYNDTKEQEKGCA